MPGPARATATPARRSLPPTAPTAAGRSSTNARALPATSPTAPACAPASSRQARELRKNVGLVHLQRGADRLGGLERTEQLVDLDQLVLERLVVLEEAAQL